MQFLSVAAHEVVILTNSSTAIDEKGNFCILIQISLNFGPECPFDNKSALVQIMPWRLLTHTCATLDGLKMHNIYICSDI